MPSSGNSYKVRLLLSLLGRDCEIVDVEDASPELARARADARLPFGKAPVLELDDGRLLPEREALLKRLTGTLVVDHVGKFMEPVPVDHPAFRVLLKLVDNGRTWVKLSAPYEWSRSGPPNYTDVGKLASALARAAPDRMLWATNWPHPTPGIQKPDDAWVLDMMLDWVPDEATRTKALVDNPARLYGF